MAPSLCVSDGKQVNRDGGHFRGCILLLDRGGDISIEPQPSNMSIRRSHLKRQAQPYLAIRRWPDTDHTDIR